MTEILALGDCNLLGDTKYQQNAYPERFAKLIGKRVYNAGYTMSTTREMLYFFEEYFSNECNIVLIQYGLVDSWKTFRYAPYVLYYPDNPFRKIARKIVKKYKKLARKYGLNRLFGTKYVVSPKEYKANIEKVIQKASDCMVILIDAIPNKQQFRNKEIIYYNEILSNIAKQYENCFKLDIYDDFLDNMEHFYLDDTHMNDKGYQFVTNKLFALYSTIKSQAK